MFWRVLFRTIVSLLLVAALLTAAGAIAWAAYNSGLAQGAQQAKGLAVPQGGATAPVPPIAFAPFWLAPFGWGYGLLSCLVPILVLFFLISLLRLIFWGGGHAHRHHGWDEPGTRGPWRHRRWNEWAEEWHRQQHSAESGKPSGSGDQKA